MSFRVGGSGGLGGGGGVYKFGASGFWGIVTDFSTGYESLRASMYMCIYIYTYIIPRCIPFGQALPK